MPIGPRSNFAPARSFVPSNELGAAGGVRVSIPPNRRAFYCDRVQDIPTPRWTASHAKFHGIKMPAEVPMALQERAYTSPVWYVPAKG